MKNMMLFVLFLLPLSAWADEDFWDNTGGCSECNYHTSAPSAPSPARRNSQTAFSNKDLRTSKYESINIVDQLVSGNIRQINKNLKFNERCDNFANMTPTNGNLAHSENAVNWGAMVLEEMNRQDHPELYKGTNDLVDSCPAFPQLTDDQKELVWVVILDSMSHLESSCTPFVANKKAPHGVAAGLLQLNSGKEHKIIDGCNRGDATNVRGSMSCGLELLNKQLGSERQLFSDDAHWAVLRTKYYSKKMKRWIYSEKYKSVQSALQQFDLCKLR